jgi:hypothetical protein
LCVQPNRLFFHLTKMINCCANYLIIHVNTSNVFLLLYRILVIFITDFISWCRFQIRYITCLQNIKVDHDLLTTLIERWRQETHMFHLHVGEMTPTL